MKKVILSVSCFLLGALLVIIYGCGNQEQDQNQIQEQNRAATEEVQNSVRNVTETWEQTAQNYTDPGANPNINAAASGGAKESTTFEESPTGVDSPGIDTLQNTDEPGIDTMQNATPPEVWQEP